MRVIPVTVLITVYYFTSI